MEVSVRIAGTESDASRAILSHGALEFLELLARRFEPERQALLARRTERQRALDAGSRPDFLEETLPIREAEWSVAPIPADLTDRRVEITGPTDRRTIARAMSSGANVFMADFEDSTSPTWKNVLEGQRNLREAVRGTMASALMVRPRGWHLVEKHLRLDDEPISASLVDFGLYFFHNARTLVDRGSGPYFYLPKLEGHLEARLWDQVFVAAQDALGIPRGTIRATVLIETILAAFEMDEILYELRDHAAGLNCGRWDYVFSMIKCFREHAEFVTPDRVSITMTTHGLRSYSLLAIQTCHRRNTHAIGGVAAQIPVEGDPEANRAALAKVRADKEREAGDGHDGTWVVHPELVALARESFDARISGASQIDRKREDVHVTARDLLIVPAGEITEAGVRQNIDAAIRYLAAWLAGSGCVPIHDVMEDAASAELSRAQLWQWIRHAARLDDGRTMTLELCRELIADELARLDRERFGRAARLLQQLIETDPLVDSMTAAAYSEID